MSYIFFATSNVKAVTTAPASFTEARQAKKKPKQQQQQKTQ